MSSEAVYRPQVSIGVPAFNEERYLRQTLESLLAQDFRDFELIISDNASTDNTARICEEFQERDARITYHRRTTNVGCVANLNGLFELASGKYFMWAGAHDLWDSKFISRAVSALESNPEVVVVFGQAMLIDTGGKSLRVMSDDLDTRGLSPLQRYLKLIWNLQSCNIVHGLMRADVLRQSLMLSLTWGSDIILLGDLALRGSFEELPEVFFYRREIRPGEGDDLEAWKKRALATVEGSRRSRRHLMSLEELHREMRDEELRMIWRSNLNLSGKLSALWQTIKCARSRYGVRLPADVAFRVASGLRSPRMFAGRVRARLQKALRGV